MIKPVQTFVTVPITLIGMLCALDFAAFAAPPPPYVDPCSMPATPCPDQYDPTSCDDGSGGGSGCSGCSQPSAAGVPQYWISEPLINTRLEDTPLWYFAARGKPVAFHLSYRQRGSVELDSSIFGLGPNWSCSFRAFVISVGGSPEGLRVHRAGAGWLIYTNGLTQYRDGSIINSVTGGGYQITYPDGSTNIFTDAFTDGTTTYYFITSQADPAGNTTTYAYSSASGIAQLVSVTDPDGLVTHLYYNDTTYPNQITSVVDPFSRTTTLTYDDSTGYLTNIVDVEGLSSSFSYDPNNPGWITTLTTPYGATTFSYSGADENSSTLSSANNQINRSALVTLPTGGQDLYLYRQDCSGFMSTTYPTVPVTTPFGNTLDNVDQQNRNSFHWNPLQYTGLSTGNPTNFSSSDYLLGKLSHWLTNAAVASSPSDTVSVQRQPSQSSGNAGQLIWFDYSGKTSGNNYVGTNAQPSVIALVLPDTSTRYTHYSRNPYSKVTQQVSTYTKTDGSWGQRTNSFTYAANNIDLVRQIGPNNEQVVSNYFASGNIFHEPNASYDALNQATLYTYNSHGQLTSIEPPTGLTTTNIYFTSGAGLNRVEYSYDFSASQNFRSNAFTYANGLVQTLTDERGVTLTKYWDNLQRLTGVAYPDSTAISNIYTILDLTATKDRLGNWTYSGYDSMRHKIAETNANSVVTRYGYCECGALTSRTNAWSTAAQQVITYSYDYQGNQVYVYFPDITVTNWFNAVGQLDQRSDERGLRYFYFNNQGLQTNTSSAYGAEQGTIFDIEDRPLYATDANGVTVTNTYDLLGRAVTRGYPDGGIEHFGYSPLGIVAYTNQISMATYYAYDAASRKTFETNANSGVTQFKYDASGNLTNLIDPKLQSTTWGYDQFSRVTNKVDQAGAVVLIYAYDPDNRLISRWSAAKGTTYYTNDAVGNLTYIKYPASTRVSLQYDWLNRLTNMADAAGTTKYTYTLGNQVLTEAQPFTSSTLTNTYLNRLRTSLSLQQPTGVWTNVFGYDAAERMTNVTSPAGAFAYTLGGSAADSSLVKNCSCQTRPTLLILMTALPA